MPFRPFTLDDFDEDRPGEIGLKGDFDVVQYDQGRRGLLKNGDDAAISESVGPQAAASVMGEIATAQDPGPAEGRHVGQRAGVGGACIFSIAKPSCQPAADR
ncbi:MAG TPA: hypothetical protein VLL77_01885 [Anaerolineales bacterium]|nr:hypothetical protein [Anaerolineales bacterium]